VVIGPGGQALEQALLDTGADDVIFPMSLAGRLGLDLSKAAAGSAQGVGSSRPADILYAPVILLLTDGQETCRWRATVGFTQASLRFSLFGIAGGLEYFRTTLDVEQQEIVLLPKPSLPVTQDPVP
jgi:hypothetical protein